MLGLSPLFPEKIMRAGGVTTKLLNWGTYSIGCDPQANGMVNKRVDKILDIFSLIFKILDDHQSKRVVI